MQILPNLSNKISHYFDQNFIDCLSISSTGTQHFTNQLSICLTKVITTGMLIDVSERRIGSAGPMDSLTRASSSTRSRSSERSEAVRGSGAGAAGPRV